MFSTEIMSKILFQSRGAWAKRASLRTVMNLHDYIIAMEGIDWRPLLALWTPPLPEKFALWFVNRFGDAFVATPDGYIHHLDVGAGTCTMVARSRDEFARSLDLPLYREKWLRLSAVDACLRSKIELARGECYGFKIPPALQGTYEVSNLVPTKLDAHYSWMSHLSRQDSIYWIEP